MKGSGNFNTGHGVFGYTGIVHVLSTVIQYYSYSRPATCQNDRHAAGFVLFPSRPCSTSAGLTTCFSVVISLIVM